MDGIYRQLASPIRARFKASRPFGAVRPTKTGQTQTDAKALTRFELFKGARGYLHAEGRPARP